MRNPLNDINLENRCIYLARGRVDARLAPARPIIYTLQKFVMKYGVCLSAYVRASELHVRVGVVFKHGNSISGGSPRRYSGGETPSLGLQAREQEEPSHDRQEYH